MIAVMENTTHFVVAVPTASAPPRTERPFETATKAISHPKIKPLKRDFITIITESDSLSSDMNRDVGSPT